MVLKNKPKWKGFTHVGSSLSKRPIEIDEDGTINLVDDTQSVFLLMIRFNDRQVNQEAQKSQKSSFNSERVQEKVGDFCGSLLDQLKRITKTKKYDEIQTRSVSSYYKERKICFSH